MRLHVAVRGQVQGVGFRYFVHQAAQRRGLAGWVRNLDDGSVEVMAEGNADAISALRVDLQTGPRNANVTSVDDLGESAEPLSMRFTILR